MKSIGGYLGLELAKSRNTLTDGKFLFNSGRSACLYYLKKNKINALWVPYYICGDFVDTLHAYRIKVNLYELGPNLELGEHIDSEHPLLFVNYFGSKDEYIGTIAEKRNHLIIDNSQALFNAPINSLPTFYSFRKFLGVPDGGMLYAPGLNEVDELPEFFSYNNSNHLLMQVDISTEEGYPAYKQNEQRIINSEIAKISKLSKLIVESVDVSEVVRIRQNNYSSLDELLSDYNRLKLDTPSLYSYPLMVDKGKELRNHLIKMKIFTPVLWADQLDLVHDKPDRKLIEDIIHLPIDQRYGKKEMQFICESIQEYYA